MSGLLLFTTTSSFLYLLNLFCYYFLAFSFVFARIILLCFVCMFYCFELTIFILFDAFLLWFIYYLHLLSISFYYLHSVPANSFLLSLDALYDLLLLFSRSFYLPCCYSSLHIINSWVDFKSGEHCSVIHCISGHALYHCIFLIYMHLYCLAVYLYAFVYYFMLPPLEPFWSGHSFWVPVSLILFWVSSFFLCLFSSFNTFLFISWRFCIIS